MPRPPGSGSFIKEIESQVGWTTQLPWSAGTLDQRRLRWAAPAAPGTAVTELAQLDASGKEQAARVGGSPWT